MAATSSAEGAHATNTSQSATEPGTQWQASPSPQSSRHHSCALCHQRKVKCNRMNPCSYCAARGLACVPLNRTTAGPRKKRFPEAELLARLRRYEAALKSYGADMDGINSASSDDTIMNAQVKTRTSSISAPALRYPATPRPQPGEQELIQNYRSHTPWPSDANDVCPELPNPL